MRLLLRLLGVAVVAAVVAAVWCSERAGAASAFSAQTTLLDIKDRARNVERLALQIAGQTADSQVRSQAFGIAVQAHRLFDSGEKALLK